MGNNGTSRPDLLPPKLSSENYSRPRVFGSEQEYGVVVTDAGGVPLPLKDNHGNFWRFVEGDISRFLSNGCRVYLDTGYHPEYASPEVSDPLRAVGYDQAGDLIIPNYIEPKNNFQKLRFFKHNTDSHGHFYGSHESYSLDPTKMDYLAFAIIPFLTSRSIITGSGFFNKKGKYFISQKGGGINKRESLNTTEEKPIFNTRDEPLANSGKYQRLHVVSGDANMSQISSLMKFGATALILDLLEDENLPLLEITNPVLTFKNISSDLEFKQKYKVDRFKLKHGLFNKANNYGNRSLIVYECNKEMTAIDIQRVYQKAAEESYKGRDPLTDYILKYWDFILNALSSDYTILDRTLDWVIKKRLIDQYKRKYPDRMDKCLLINLRYHEIGKEGLFHMLQSEGEVETILSSDKIEFYAETPPHDTRARIRGWAASIKDTGILRITNPANNSFFMVKEVYWDWFRYKTKSNNGLCSCPDHKCANFVCITQKLDDPLDAYEGLESKLLNGK